MKALILCDYVAKISVEIAGQGTTSSLTFDALV